MCVSDWRLGRHIRSVVRIQALTINDTMAIPPNPSRVGLILSSATYLNSAATAATVLVDGLAVSLLHQGAPLFEVDIRSHGDLVTKAWNITTSAGSAANVSAIEFILDEATMRSEYEEFKRRV